MEKTVKDEYGREYHIGEQIGRGGQGAVFRVSDDETIVIKCRVVENEKDDSISILKSETKYEEYKAKIISVMAVGEFKNVAVPFSMLEKPYCGYVMRMMSGLMPLEKFLKPFLYKNKNGQICINDADKEAKKTTNLTKDEFAFWYNSRADILKRIKCLANLADILRQFEVNNIVYCDLSPGNVFISESREDFEAWLIDLDNLEFSSKIKSPIGTPQYMAPEVANGKNNTIYSDRYSFALLAYYFLFVVYPFNGQAEQNFDDWDDDAPKFEEEVAKGNIPWIWEEKDKSNRKHNDAHPTERIPKKLFDLFEKTFNRDGRKNPTHRPSMQERYDVLIETSESSFRGYLEFKEKSFDALRGMKKSKNDKAFLTNFVTLTEPFQKNIKKKPYVVTIENIVQVKDEEGNSFYTSFNDKEIFWDPENNDEFYLSNYDICLRRPKNYIPHYVTLRKDESIILNSKKFDIDSIITDYEVFTIEDNVKRTYVSDISNSVLYVKDSNNKIIKKITIRQE